MKFLLCLMSLQFLYSSSEYIAYEHLGCYEGWAVKSYMQQVLGRGDKIDAILRCYELAREKDFKVFAITDGNECRSSRDAHRHVDFFRKARGCDDNGLGGHGRADLYMIEGGNSCETMANGEYQDSQFCNSFVTCYNHKLYRQVCPDGLLFKASTRQCEAAWVCPGGYRGEGNICKPSDKVLNVPCPYGRPCRHAPDGEYAHPETCRRYVVCRDHIAHEMICPGNLWFNRITRQCSSPAEAKCAQDPCSQSNNPCQNGATCTRSSDHDKTYECKCPSEYQGDHCEKHIPNPCSPNPCKNGGTCKKLSVDKFNCSCASAYRGDTCSEIGHGLEKSSIIGSNSEYVRTLENWLMATSNHGHHVTWRRCHEAVRDGWSSGTFHSHCNGKGSTVTIIKSIHGGHDYIFGGYNRLGWEGSGYKSDTKGFLFSLKNTLNLKPFIMRQYQHPQNSYYANNGYGPTFGGGHDLYIATNANANRNSYTNLGHTYRPPSNYKYGGNAKTVLAGEYNFSPANYEVFYAVHNN